MVQFYPITSGVFKKFPNIYDGTVCENSSIKKVLRDSKYGNDNDLLYLLMFVSIFFIILW